MSCLTQHKTKEELSNWLMENASDNETTGFLDMLAGDIWDMMDNMKVSRDDGWYLARLIEKETIELKKEIAETTKKLKKEHIQNIMKTKSIATELYREVKYSLGYGEFDEPDRKVMYDDIKKLKKELEKWQGERLEFGSNVMKWKDDIDTILYGDKDGCSGCWEQRISDIKKLKEREFRMCEIANANGWDIYPTDSEEESEEE